MAVRETSWSRWIPVRVEKRLKLRLDRHGIPRRDDPDYRSIEDDPLVIDVRWCSLFESAVERPRQMQSRAANPAGKGLDGDCSACRACDGAGTAGDTTA
jgi:hypothetical protein